MSTFYLVRHGCNDYLGRGLAGRLPKVHLNEQGKLEAERMAHLLAKKGIQQIFSSPLERASETAAPLGRVLNLPVQIAPEFHEIDFGDWTGRSMEELNGLAEWKSFNSVRSITRIPNGELVLEAQARFVRKLEELRRQFPQEVIAVFSHADPIKTALAYYLGVPLDLLTRIEIDPGSYSALQLNAWAPQILAVNVKPE